MIIGYARIATNEQTTQSQVNMLKEFGCTKIFEEIGSGNNINRPELQVILNTIQKGDQVVVCNLDRMSRNAKHLIELIELFEEKGVELISINDNSNY